MKQILFAAGIAAISLASCNNNVEPTFNDSVDSLTYELGVSQADGLRQYMTMQLQVDTTQLDEFIKGMKEGALQKSDNASQAYSRGVEVGRQIQQMAEGLGKDVYPDDSTKTVKVENLLAGIIAGLKRTAGETTDQAYERYNALMAPIRSANMERQFGDNKKAGEKYLADNAKKAGVKALASGVQYKVLNAGSGEMPADTATVNVRYEGKLIDGTVFDSNTGEGREPMPVNLAKPQLIPGFAEVLKMMPYGAKWEVTIPQAQAYGESNMGQIKPFSTLIFTIEIVK